MNQTATTVTNSKTNNSLQKKKKKKQATRLFLAIRICCNYTLNNNCSGVERCKPKSTTNLRKPYVKTFWCSGSNLITLKLQISTNPKRIRTQRQETTIYQRLRTNPEPIHTAAKKVQNGEIEDIRPFQVSTKPTQN